ncbi:MAG: 30S ribosomal protein S4 [Candidatus Caldatribacteriota bacterium]|jgi:small subunit ribosomal protein S4|nr:30S ribosomal protein S4 [Atribacterota bacterium]MDD3030905.1 30S ribosomal protein S4 [Atribacterota bacterium]MDD3640695.1 30S ribosomal protein S4 [Atribacterota bacterium]MDD4288477.1 30S ribosomal protein S4 [Atribacterota bacterium]MDD4764310.1 30S ribosomal protein S4 [Atribacterota bacterium]
MARYTGPVCRLCRRQGTKLFLKGERCYTEKCAVEKRENAPGKSSQSRRVRKLSNYAIQLKEKQKMKDMYGLLEKQFSNLFEKAEKKHGVTGENFIQFLERRLDNIVYRLGFANSRAKARQLVRHSHILVNGKKVNIPSYMAELNDVIEVRGKSQSINELKELKEEEREVNVPSWLEADIKNLKGKVVKLPSKEDIDMPIDEKLVVEFYSR